MEFRWNEWNREHIVGHGVNPWQAEYVVRRARRPFPQASGDGKFLVMGPEQHGLLLRVIYVLDPDETVFVIHAMPLTENDKRRYRRRMK